ncbi:ahpC/TSA family protein [Lyngbya aestuarii BL J]|uniref:AhpC/TSA family protein n=2 Tax=Lyngbya aestuarii BL J TaxID=1348334 RepID=U7QJ94_9CYAN|nr:thioredoxin-like domain-containing protein [Lyngbya aestuarii]ERT08029.1 ahpC/TSA family protein [Lyngbya aestuarii BL J]
MPNIHAPELPQNFPWLNTEHPLSLKSLRGRVVLLDFWTYCCINCLHILPDLKYFEQKYRDSITVIGVHSAKFDHEKEVENIRQAILRYDIEHPVVVDNGFQVWQQYTVNAWPTLVLIDPKGYYVRSVAGEGNREIIDNILNQLIEEHKTQGTINFEEVTLTLEKEKQPLITPLAFPGKVLADATENRLFIADSGHHRIIISTTEGEVLEIIGTGKAGLTDGSFEQAQLFAPQGMTLDKNQQVLYVADTENHAIRKIDLQQKTVETIAGNGEQSPLIYPHGGMALETQLNSPWDLEKVGDKLYIAMAGCHQIWVMNLETHQVETYAGLGAESCVDGELLEAAFSQPSGITTNGVELLIADSEISSIRGVGLGENTTVRTICGSGDLFGFGDEDGEGFEVRLQHCLGVEFAQNYLWVADTYNHKIKRVYVNTGYCETVLGNDGSFSEPSGLSAAGSLLYVADTNHHQIRQVNLETLTVKTLTFPGLCAPDVCIPKPG